MERNPIQVVDEKKVGEAVEKILEAFQALGHAERLEACAGLVVLTCIEHNVRGPILAKQAMFLAARMVDLDTAVFAHHESLQAAWFEQMARSREGKKSS